MESFEQEALAIVEEMQARRLSTYLFEPLEIKFDLASPVVLTYPWICIDGYVAYATGLDILGQDTWALFQDKNPRDIWDALPVPIARIGGKDGSFFYKCSVGRFSDPGAISSRQYNKMFCSEGIASNIATKRSYMIVGGQFKLRCIRYPVNYSSSITFWCNGDKTWLGMYCKGLLAFGARTAAGNGRIEKYTITSIPRDFSILHPVHGVNRPVPVPAAIELGLPDAGTRIASLSCKPPNWSKANHVLCRIPEGFT